MVLTWLTAGLLERLAEKTVDVAVQQGLTAWQLRRLEHTCSPVLRCEAAQVNVTCPDVREPQGCSCAYQDLLNQLLRALVTLLALVTVLLGSCVECLALRRRPAAVTPVTSSSGKSQAVALRAKYGAP